MTTFLITGATGNVGQAVLTYLRDDEHQRICRASHHREPANSTERWLDFADSLSFQSALHQIDVVFLLRPPHLANVKLYFNPFIAACRQASVKHIVFLSVQGAEKTPYIPHAKLEKLIRSSGIAYTFLRPSYFMQNLTTTLRDDIVRHHKLFLPAGRAPFLWVDVDDIGRAAAVVLTNWPSHKNQAYTLTGSELLTFEQVSRLLSKRIGYRVSYQSPNLIRFYITKRREGMAFSLVLVMIMLHFLPRFQSPPQISPAFTRLTGRRPNTVHAFIDQQASNWME